MANELKKILKEEGVRYISKQEIKTGNVPKEKDNITNKKVNIPFLKGKKYSWAKGSGSRPSKIDKSKYFGSEGYLENFRVK